MGGGIVWGVKWIDLVFHFAELARIDDGVGVGDAESDVEVVVVSEDAALAAAEDVGNGAQYVDVDYMGLQELEARINEAARSIEVQDQEDQGQEEGDEPPARKQEQSEQLAKKVQNHTHTHWGTD